VDNASSLEGSEVKRDRFSRAAAIPGSQDQSSSSQKTAGMPHCAIGDLAENGTLVTALALFAPQLHNRADTLCGQPQRTQRADTYGDCKKLCG
jgi:hypothetical protein